MKISIREILLIAAEILQQEPIGQSRGCCWAIEQAGLYIGPNDYCEFEYMVQSLFNDLYQADGYHGAWYFRPEWPGVETEELIRESRLIALCVAAEHYRHRWVTKRIVKKWLESR